MCVQRSEHVQAIPSQMSSSAMFARILTEVETQMLASGLLESYDSPGLFPTDTEATQQHYLGLTWTDDLCIQPPMPLRLNAKQARHVLSYWMPAIVMASHPI